MWQKSTLIISKAIIKVIVQKRQKTLKDIYFTHINNYNYLDSLNEEE